MTRQEAIERVAKAVLRNKGYSETKWEQYPNQKQFAEDLLIGLEALGLLKLTAG
jgi:hypothetical protein